MSGISVSQQFVVRVDGLGFRERPLERVPGVGSLLAGAFRIVAHDSMAWTAASTSSLLDVDARVEAVDKSGLVALGLGDTEDWRAIISAIVAYTASVIVSVVWLNLSLFPVVLGGGVAGYLGGPGVKHGTCHGTIVGAIFGGVSMASTITANIQAGIDLHSISLANILSAAIGMAIITVTTSVIVGGAGGYLRSVKST